MLAELFIQNFALIEEVRIDFQSGFNVLTGETGAGKSIILDATALVLGDRADTTVVREGSDRAYVEAAFGLDRVRHDDVRLLLKEEGLEGDEDNFLVLSRELRINGRNVCRINGRTVNLALLRSLGDKLVDIHGQGDHLSLLSPKSHLLLLDAYAGLEEERMNFRKSFIKLRDLRRELELLRQDEVALTNRRDMLSYQVAEIDAADLSTVEEDELRLERSRLSNVEQLIRYGNEALTFLDGIPSDAPSASDLLGQAEHPISQLANLDERLKPILENFQELYYQLNDLTAELIRYCDNLEHNPDRLDFIEERLELIGNLKRKYGGSISAVINWKERATAELSSLINSEKRTEELLIEETNLLRTMGESGARLSLRRQKAAGQLSSDVEREMAELSMEKALFQVAFSRTIDDRGVFLSEERFGFDETGIDTLEFQVTTNPGESLRPLAKVASGGETSRLMLALKSVLARVDAMPTLIFDEIDQGIGGRVGDVVGRKLWSLTTPAEHQVIVVTHLPQLAGYADGHFHVSKRSAGDRTITEVEHLNVDGQLEELAAMLGTGADVAKGGAESILRRANEVKTGS